MCPTLVKCVVGSWQDWMVTLFAIHSIDEGSFRETGQWQWQCWAADINLCKSWFDVRMSVMRKGGKLGVRYDRLYVVAEEFVGISTVKTSRHCWLWSVLESCSWDIVAVVHGETTVTGKSFVKLLWIGMGTALMVDSWLLCAIQILLLTYVLTYLPR